MNFYLIDGASNNSISEIKQYEQDFFSNSKLFRYLSLLIHVYHVYLIRVY